MEDDPLDCAAIERLFVERALAYELVCAGSVAEAVAIHREGGCDVALLDHHLPDGTGMDLLAQLEGVPCVFIAGAEELSVAIAAMKAGASDFIAKDSAREYVERLPQVIMQVLRLSRLREGTRRRTRNLNSLVERRTSELAEANERLREEMAVRQRAVESLAGSERRFRDLVETSHDLVWRCDRDGCFIYLNPAWEKTHGYAVQELLGRTPWSLASSDFAERDGAKFARLMDDGSGTRWETRHLAKSGEIVHLTFNAVVASDDEGRHVGAQGTANDVTELKAAQARLSEMNDALEHLIDERTEQLMSANAELEAFAYSVSHDLKTPLRAIDGYSALLEQRHETSLSPEGRRLVGVVRESTHQMGRLIDDLLDLSRIGRIGAVASAVDMGELANSAFTGLYSAEDGRSVDFSVGDLPTIQGDVTLLRQVWLNLLENALKFTSGRDVARIQVDCREEVHHWVFRVQDNGAGFDQEHSGRLFGVFERLHDREEFPGTGIGLATVKRVIERHGGEVWAEGEVDVGATLFLRLPLSGKVR